jgi:hypothetical protein
MNVELLLKVKQAILEEPRRFDMAEWSSEDVYGKAKIPNCGTTCCMSGWATAIYNRDNGARFGYPDGEDVLDISSEQGDRLFFLSQWPSPFHIAYKKAMRNRDNHGMAQAAADRIDYFIETGL